jgi:propanol-preferring alcohol dehydrogenase
MQAGRLRETGAIQGRPLEVGEVAVPRPGVGPVLLRVRACGVCRTDLHIVEGELPVEREHVIQGHQIVGDGHGRCDVGCGRW